MAIFSVTSTSLCVVVLCFTKSTVNFEIKPCCKIRDNIEAIKYVGNFEAKFDEEEVATKTIVGG